MATYRYPVLVWRDHAGFFTAAPVEDLWLGYDSIEELAAVAPSAGIALGQLTEYLTWKGKKGTTLPEPRVHDLSRQEFVVHARPAYHVERRSFPSDKSVRLPVDCVVGKLDDQLYLASLPQFDVRLYFFEGDLPKDLITHHLHQLWKGKSPRDLSRFLPPRMSFLDEIVVKTPTQPRRSMRRAPSQQVLQTVASALDARGTKRLFNPAWEREREVTDLTGRFKSEQTNIIIVGESGIGKTTVLAEAVRRLRKGIPQSEPRRFWLTSASRIIAGMKYLGQWEERCQKVIAELQHIDGVLCVESLLDLVRVGGVGASDSVASFLSTYIQAGELRMVAEATAPELEACRRLLPGFVDLFQLLAIDELGERRSIDVLDRLADQKIKQRRGLSIERGVTDQLYHLFARFFPYGAFPGPAAAFLTDLIDGVVNEGGKVITGEALVELFIRRTGLPEVFIRDEKPLVVDDAFKALSAEVIGQGPSCNVAADVVCTFKAGLNDPGKPVAVLLFCGPTGVGKTQLARSLSEFCFGHGDEKDRLVRLDMSEYATSGSAERLLGESSTGGSDLVKRVRQQPFMVLLLDEIEKAAPEVFDVLLNLLDEGRLIDAFGRLTSFRSAIIIMTSNLGVRTHDPVGFGAEPSVGYVDEVERFFRPEFVNRIDEVLSFSPLSRETIMAITEKELLEITVREGLDTRHITLSWNDEVVHRLAEMGYSPRYGARNLQRTLERHVVIPLARLLLDDPELKDTTLHLVVDEGGVVGFQLSASTNG